MTHYQLPSPGDRSGDRLARLLNESDLELARAQLRDYSRRTWLQGARRQDLVYENTLVGGPFDGEVLTTTTLPELPENDQLVGWVLRTPRRCLWCTTRFAGYEYATRSPRYWIRQTVTCARSG